MRSRGLTVLATLLACAGIALGPAPQASAEDFGFVGPVYGTSTSAPTGQKPQSKLWVADGIWWGALFDGISKDFHVFRHDWVANDWIDTGVLIDERTNVYVDTLWDGEKLYVVSAGTSASSATHSPRLLRFSYDSSTQRWSRDAGYPITPMGNGGVEAAVIAKDSTGLLWATYTQGSKVYVTHSSPGEDERWVPRYELPTPAGESSVSPDDISTIVSFDGDKVGVLWSNQVAGVETMYWAWHQDGTSDQAWNLEIAYRQPEGADDHMNLKSVVGDPSGRVFAVAKTSMNASTDPLLNLLTLSLDGQWSATPVWTKADDTTRAIVQLDTQAREVYVFGAAPCCSGGTIYYKKSGLDKPSFSPGVGTPFIHSDAHPEANNPTSTKQNLSGSTGLVVMASDDETRTYLYNRLTLGGSPPADTTPPETTITSGPPATTGDTEATFEFSSSEPGSSFTCRLDAAASQACTSPAAYSGLAAGTHTFTVASTDAAGNTDPTPAHHSWTIGTPAVFSDDFGSGDFSAGGWDVRVGGDGSATVLPGAVHPENLGARLVSTSTVESSASIRRPFAAQQTLTFTWDAKVVASRTGQQFSLAKVYGPSGRVLSLIRDSSGALLIQDLGTTVPTSASLGLDQAARIGLTLTQGTTDSLSLSMDGAQVFSSTTLDLGSAFNAVRVGDDAKRRTLDYRVDNVVVTS